MSFKDSKTAENLMKSFAGESQARMRYVYAAKTAKRQALSKYQTSSPKPPKTKRNTPSSSSNTC